MRPPPNPSLNEIRIEYHRESRDNMRELVIETLELPSMAYEKKVVLKYTGSGHQALKHLVEAFLADGVALVATVGTDCEKVEDMIDELVVGDGSKSGRFLMTTSHPGESLEEVLEFAEAFSTDPPGKVQIVEL